MLPYSYNSIKYGGEILDTDQLRILTKMKRLIKNGNRRFQMRKDRDYIQDLLELGIDEVEAWDIILTLNNHFYFKDPKPTYYKNKDTLIFKRKVNGVLTYIKLKIETKNKEETVCLSFHKDKKF